MGATNNISPSQLIRLIGTPDCPLLVDVGLDEDYEQLPYLIPGAAHYLHQHLDVLHDAAEDCQVIVICQKGRKLSHGLMSLLQSIGIDAPYLTGGNGAWHRLDEAPSIAGNRLNATQRWLTRHRPKIDPIAYPWLIRRFINPKAEFLLVSPNEVLSVAERYDALPFDVPDVFWGHRGSGCTFDTLIDEFVTELDTLALQRLATVERAADTNQHDLAPEATGLFALSTGLSRLYQDDHAQLKAGHAQYDAIYRWARDAYTETHEHNDSRKSS